MNTANRILIIDDDEHVLNSMMRLLRSSKFQAQSFTNAQQALELCANQEFDLIISDQHMPALTGIEFFEKIRILQPLCRLILISGYRDFGEVVNAFNQQIVDKFVIKPWDNDTLIDLIKDQLKTLESNKIVEAKNDTTIASKRISKIKAANNGLKEFHGIFTNDETLLKQADLFQLTHASTAPILISGEIGTGKRLMAEAAHCASYRSEFPFEIINNNFSSAQELELLLFGNDDTAKDETDSIVGLLSSANNGTIVFNEITTLPLEIQRKLIEAMELKTFSPIGSKERRPFDIRIIATSTEDLDSAVAEKRLVEEFRHQLDVLSFRLPPLRERTQDIVPMFDMFLNYELQIDSRTYLEIDPLVKDLIRKYSWPGNVVELKNMCTYIASLAKTTDGYIGINTLPLAIRKAALKITPKTEETNSLDKLDKSQLHRIIEEFSGKIEPAAKFLGVDRLVLWQRIQKLNLEMTDFT